MGDRGISELCSVALTPSVVLVESCAFVLHAPGEGGFGLLGFGGFWGFFWFFVFSLVGWGFFFFFILLHVTPIFTDFEICSEIFCNYISSQEFLNVY